MSYKDKLKQQEYQRQWMKNRRAYALEYLGGRCIQCGTTEDLEFHHVDPAEKDNDIQTIISCTWERLQKELDKCELLCSQHHKEFHAIYNQKEHGTTLYRKGCRCDLCKEAHRISNYKWKHRQDHSSVVEQRCCKAVVTGSIPVGPAKL